MDLVNRAATAAGVEPKTSTVPRFALWIATFFDPLVYELWEMEFVRDRPYIIDHTDFSRIDPDFSPTSLEEGIAATVDWYRKKQPNTHTRK